MIGYLTGKLLAKQPPQLLLDVNGVGYELEAPLSTFFNLPALGQTVSLHTHLSVREDAHQLYGFGSLAEKSLFRELIKVSGVGPKLALTVLSGAGVDAFWAAVRSGEVSALTRLPGVGKKTAERLTLEMKDKPGAVVIAGAGPVTVAAGPLPEARAALVSLGFKLPEVQKLTDAVHAEGMSTEQIIQAALKRVSR